MAFNPKSATETQTRAIFGVSRQTLNEWRNAGAPFVKQGKNILYDLPKLIAWKIERAMQQQMKQVPASGGCNGSEALEDFRRARAKLAELELALKTGDLVHINRVNENYNTAATLLRTALNEVVIRLPEKLSGKDVREIGKVLEDETLSLLRDYSAQLKKAAGGLA